MSFILDALKKAESERSRNSGPVLMDVRVAPPRRRLPAWAWVLGVVLLANLGVLAWLLLREPARPATAGDGSPASSTAPAVAAPPAAPSPAPAQSVAPPAAAATELPPPTQALDSLPTMQDLAAVGIALPALQLNLHVYDPAPALRYVLLNGARLGEGEYTADGIKVEAITPQGVVLEASGRRFRVPAGG